MSDLLNLFDDEDMSDLLNKKESKRDTTISKNTEKPQKLNKETLYHCNQKIQIGTNEYNMFTEEKYNRSLNFYDFEVFKYDWLVVIINPVENIKTIIWNDKDGLQEYYNNHRKEVWVGYNSRNYDTFILKGILLGMNPKKINDMIINEGKKGFQISDKFRNINLYNFDIATKIQSLKQLEGFMGNDIRETTIPFDLPRQLTESEAKEVIYYCTHDVEQTIEVFKRRGEVYDSQVALIDTFDLPFNDISLTQAQLTAKILECEPKEYDDEFKISIAPTIHLKKYKYVQDWFIEAFKRKDYSDSLETNICGIPHLFGWGGLHGCPDNPIYRKGKILHVDVNSFYPSLMIQWDLLSRNSNHKEKYKEVYETRLALKRAGKKKEQAPYKIILNSTYGICKDKNSKAYDPRRANEICVNGQLMLLDLLEHLEGKCEIIQSNTDGLIIMVDDNEESLKEVDTICRRWEKRTRCGLATDYINWICQKDVNNYCFEFSNGKYERKGAYVKENNDLDNDLPIINESLVRYIIDGIKPEETIRNCDDFKMFQKIVRISGNYLYGVHNNERLTDRTFRVYASTNFRDSSIYKVKTEGGRLEKFANTPEHCFIFNESVNGLKVPDNLDKKWYISIANERLESFGLKVDDLSLF